jgi:WD40 repeat protein
LLLLVLLLGLPARGQAPTPELVLQNGHSLGIAAVAFSADGTLAATGSPDGTVRLWEVATGRVRLTLSAHGTGTNGAGVASLALTPDGRLLVTGGWDARARVWSLATGEKVAEFESFSDYYPTLVAVSPDGRTLALGNGDKVSLVELSSGQARWSANIEGVKSVAWNPQGGVLAVGTSRGRIVLLEAGSGSPRATLAGRGAANDEMAVAFSPDGRWLAGGQRSLDLWEVSSGRLARTLAGEINFSSVAWSPDGSSLAVGCRADTDRALVWDLARGALQATLVFSDDDRLRLGTDTRPLVAFHPQGRLLATGHIRSSAVTLWTLPEGRPQGALEGHALTVSDLAFSRDGRRLVSANWDGTAQVWDLAAGRLRTTLAGHQGSLYALALSRDGRRLATGGRDGTVRIWDLDTSQCLATLEGGWVYALAFSPDGRSLVAGNRAGEVLAWEIPSGRLALRQRGHSNAVTSVAFAPDSRLFASGSLDGTVLQWDAIYARAIFTRRVAARRYPGVEQVAFSPDGKTLAAATQDGTVNLWGSLDPEEARPAQVPEPVAGTSNPPPVTCLAFSPDGRWLATGHDQDHAIRIWDLAGKKLRATLQGHALAPVALACSPEGRVLASGSADGTLRFWDVPAARLLATALELDRGADWVVTTPDGLFDGSPGAFRLMEWRIGDKLLALDQFFNDFYTPGLLARLLQPPSSQGAPRASLALAQLKAPPRIQILSPASGATVSSGSLEVEARLVDQGGGASSPRLFLNGHRLPDSRAQVQGERVRFRVDLVEGVNRLRVTAFNQDGSVESRGDEIAVLCQAAQARRPTLYVLAVGIDNYQAGLRLGFARKDAQSMAGFFQPGLFAQVKATLLTDEKATRQSLLAALAEVARQAGPQDSFVLYLAGHGALLGDLFYYLPYDAALATDDDLRRSCLSSVELGQALAEIPATRQILVVDACHSGASAGALGRLLASRDALDLRRAQERLARSSGTFLIAASTAQQYAKEFPELGHGVLTYAILTGLGAAGPPAAPVNGEGQVTVNALLRYLSDEVPRLAEKFQGGRQDIVQYSLGQDFPLVLVR